MRIIEVDGRGWRTYDDVYDHLLPALGAPAWHGRNMAALIDSIGTGSINAIEPPYLLKIRGAATWPTELREFVRDLRDSVAESVRFSAENYCELRDVEIVLDGDF